MRKYDSFNLVLFRLLCSVHVFPCTFLYNSWSIISKSNKLARGENNVSLQPNGKVRNAVAQENQYIIDFYYFIGECVCVYSMLHGLNHLVSSCPSTAPLFFHRSSIRVFRLPFHFNFFLFSLCELQATTIYSHL